MKGLGLKSSRGFKGADRRMKPFLLIGEYLYRRAKAIHDLTPEYLKSMKDSDWVRVFHATGIDSHNKLGPQSMVFGIDATGEARSNYHPSTPGFYRYQGLYVGPSIQAVSQFGRLVFEFTVRAKNLHATTWSGEIPKRHPDKFEYDLPRCENNYPDSEDPLLSCSLDERGKASFRGHEPQALFIGIVPAADILAVHYINDTYTPEEFIKEYKKDLPFEKKMRLDPKSTRLSVDDYLDLMVEEHGYTKDRLISSFKRIIDRGVDVEQTLHQMLPFSGPSLKKFLTEFQKEYM